MGCTKSYLCICQAYGSCKFSTGLAPGLRILHKLHKQVTSRMKLVLVSFPHQGGNSLGMFLDSIGVY